MKRDERERWIKKVKKSAVNRSKFFVISASRKPREDAGVVRDTCNWPAQGSSEKEEEQKKKEKGSQERGRVRARRRTRARVRRRKRRDGSRSGGSKKKVTGPARMRRGEKDETSARVIIRCERCLSAGLAGRTSEAVGRRKRAVGGEKKERGRRKKTRNRRTGEQEKRNRKSEKDGEVRKGGTKDVIQRKPRRN